MRYLARIGSLSMDMSQHLDVELVETMRAVLKDRFGIELQRLDLDRPLASLGLDSLGFVEYTFELEKALKITLPDVPRETVSVGDLVAFINAEMKKHG